ncbi:hypothetical protein AVEN_84944-1 [Araneus ventricosus]|uniref:Uncharacterized protein n=1 Tax=Araneus ventricosus TaxID=182803 RepID=A0A4Y2BZK0_ARAVE|nr:hypothetical protein AVEN_84944-1 [Araneus ventricosus]
MTRITPELSNLHLSSSNIRTTLEEGSLIHVRFNEHQAHIHGGSLVESSLESTGFEAETLSVKLRLPLRDSVIRHPISLAEVKLVNLVIIQFYFPSRTHYSFYEPPSLSILYVP